MSKHGVTLLAVLALAMCHASAQFYPTAQSARNSALGGCLILQQERLTHASLGWKQGYLSQGMATKTLQGSLATGKSGLAFGMYSHFGDVVYHEQQAAIGYSIMLTEHITAGVYGLYSHIGTNDAHYPPQQWLDGGVILLASVGEKIGTYLTVGSRRWDEKRPFDGHIGTTYCPSDEFMTVAELSVEERTRLRCGMEYTYDNRYSARAGFSTNPLVMTFGVGCSMQKYHIDLTTEVHPVLGLSPQISLGICL